MQGDLDCLELLLADARRAADVPQSNDSSVWYAVLLSSSWIDQFTTILVIVLGPKFLQLVYYCDHVKSINSVTAVMVEVTMKNGLLTDIKFKKLISLKHTC